MFPKTGGERVWLPRRSWIKWVVRSVHEIILRKYDLGSLVELEAGRNGHSALIQCGWSYVQLRLGTQAGLEVRPRPSLNYDHYDTQWPALNNTSCTGGLRLHKDIIIMLRVLRLESVSFELFWLKVSVDLRVELWSEHTCLPSVEMFNTENVPQGNCVLKENTVFEAWNLRGDVEIWKTTLYRQHMHAFNLKV